MRCRCSAFMRLHDKKDHGALVTSNSRVALFDVTIRQLGWKSPSATTATSMLCKCHFTILSYVEGGFTRNVNTKEMLKTQKRSTSRKYTWCTFFTFFKLSLYLLRSVGDNRYQSYMRNDKMCCPFRITQFSKYFQRVISICFYHFYLDFYYRDSDKLQWVMTPFYNCTCGI